MNISDVFLEELQGEAPATRKLLEAVPEADFGWKPHEKSFTLVKLASHVAEIPQWVNEVLNQDVFEINRATYKPFIARNVGELVAEWDRTLEKGLGHLKNYPDAKWMDTWTMTIDGKVYMQQSRLTTVRQFVTNHLVHHRAQLGVYLRLLNVPLPSTYGPTADKQNK